MIRVKIPPYPPAGAYALLCVYQQTLRKVGSRQNTRQQPCLRSGERMDGGGLITPSPETALVCPVLVLLCDEWETRMKPRRYKV
jgi:hypothetical protein